jgi:hypothetical protein
MFIIKSRGQIACVFDKEPEEKVQDYIDKHAKDLKVEDDKWTVQQWTCLYNFLSRIKIAVIDEDITEQQLKFFPLTQWIGLEVFPLEQQLDSFFLNSEGEEEV